MQLSRFIIALVTTALQAVPCTVAAQLLKRTAVTSYTIDHGLLQNTVASMVVDQFGFAWFSTGSGVQRFDGRHFEVVLAGNSNGGYLTAPQLNLLQNGQIWISGTHGITAIDPATNRRRSIIKQPLPRPTHIFQYGGEDSSSVWYLAYRQAFLQFDKRDGRLLQKISMPAWLDTTGYRFFCYQMGPDKILLRFFQGLAIFSMKEKKLVYSQPTERPVTGLVPLNEYEFLYTRNGGYYKVNTQTRKEQFFGTAEDATPSTQFELLLTGNGSLISAYNQTIYELDTARLAIQTKWAAFNQEKLLNSGFITHIMLDRLQRLWLLTNSDGVKQLSFSRQPFQYYGTAQRENNFIRSIYFDKKKGRLLAGTYGSGLLLFDTLGQLTHRSPLLFEDNTVLSILPLQGDDYLLLTMGYRCLFIFNAETKQLKQVETPIKNINRFHASYYAGLHRTGPNRFLQTGQHLLQFSINDGKITDTVFLRPKVDFFYTFLPLKDGAYCLASNSGLEFTDTLFRRLSLATFQQPLFPRCLAQDENGALWIGTETGLYKFGHRGLPLKKYSFNDGLTDEGIYSIEPAPGGIYFSHNKGLSFLSHEGGFTHYTRHAGLQENEFNTKSSFRTNDGHLFFGGINGITAFQARHLSQKTKPAPVLITGLEVRDKPWRDTAVWNIDQLLLEHEEARIALRVGVPGGTDNASYVYEYKMEGLEPEWITTTGTDFIRYVLPPGEFCFRVRVGNGGIAPGQEKRLLITVAAPFWQQRWFQGAVLLLVILLLGFAIHRYNRSRYRKRLAQLEFEHKLQLERERISRDLHDNLGAYATAIADNVERVAKDPQDKARLKSLKTASAEIMTNLRDTIWALNKTQISMLTLCDRVKAFLQKMREAYPGVKITFEENSATNAMLSPEVALNVLRIVQEAFHNAVKHSGGNAIHIRIQLDEKLYVCIRDNGRGLPPALAQRGYGFGNMQVRAEEARLHLQIQSVREGGTSVELFSSLQ